MTEQSPPPINPVLIRDLSEKIRDDVLSAITATATLPGINIGERLILISEAAACAVEIFTLAIGACTDTDDHETCVKQALELLRTRMLKSVRDELRSHGSVEVASSMLRKRVFGEDS